MIFFGMRNFGYCDQIDGVGMVATTFFHISFFPLIPTASHFMIDDQRGIPIPMQLKSVIWAWVRASLFVSAIAFLLLAPVTFGVTLVFAAVAIAAYFAMPLLFRKAGPARTDHLRQLIRS